MGQNLDYVIFEWYLMWFDLPFPLSDSRNPTRTLLLHYRLCFAITIGMLHENRPKCCGPYRKCSHNFDITDNQYWRWIKLSIEKMTVLIQHK